MLDLQPYLLLPLQIAGLLLAAAVLRRVLGRPTLSDATAVVVVVVLAAVVVPQLWRSLVAQHDARATLIPPAGVDDFGKCFVDGSHPELVGFARWLRDRVPGTDAISVAGIVDRSCLQLNVAPHDLLGPDGKARWRVYVGGEAPPAAGRAQRYADGLTLVRVG